MKPFQLNGNHKYLKVSCITAMDAIFTFSQILSFIIKFLISTAGFHTGFFVRGGSTR